MKKLITLALTTLMIVGATSAFGQVNPAAGKHHHEMHQIMAQLNLSATQKAEIKAIHQRSKARMMKIRASNESVASKKAEAKLLHQHSKEEVGRILTPQQREKMKALRAEFKLGHKV